MYTSISIFIPVPLYFSIRKGNDSITMDTLFSAVDPEYT